MMELLNCYNKMENISLDESKYSIMKDGYVVLDNCIIKIFSMQLLQKKLNVNLIRII